MNQAEAVRRAMVELGDVSAEELAAFIGTKYGVTVRPQFVPVLKATLRTRRFWQSGGGSQRQRHRLTLEPGSRTNRGRMGFSLPD